MAANGSGELMSRLTALKAQIEEASAERSEQQGVLRGLMGQLKQDYGVATLEEAEASLADMTARIETLEQTLADRLAEAEAALAEAP